ncbi:MAG: TIM barrel protein [Verrucomicrobiota bacterium]|jgi:sugar phosphate isomerase/epimerase
MQTTRRQFIQSGLVCAAGMTVSPKIALAAEQAKTVSIGFQLYTVRGEFARNVPDTIKTLAQIGYRGVEFWDYSGTPEVYQHYSAADLRKILDENGLKCCGMHVTLEALSGDKLKRTIENNQTLGNIYINLVMAPDLMKSESGIGELAALLNQVSTECQAQKMVAGYHCHAFDFAKINGRFAWEILFSRLKPEVNMQLDVGNCLSGGGDPIAMFKEFPGRSWSVHIKEYKDKTFDNDFYKEVFRLCETTCATKWYIVEMGSEDGTGFDVPRQALAKLHSLGK